MVAKKLLEEIIPRFGLPVSIGSENGPAFVSKIVRGLASALGTGLSPGDQMEVTLQIQSPELRTGRKNESDPKRNFNKTGNRD